MLAYFRGMPKMLFFYVFLSLLSYTVIGQPVEKRLSFAMSRFCADSQLTHAIASITVADGVGKIIYHHNDHFGLSPASNMKVFTGIAAMDLLGETYRFSTEMGIDGSISDSVLRGNVYVVGNGDPTLGSWRYAQTKPDVVTRQITAMLREKGINRVEGDIILDGSRFANNAIPGGWAWDDMGNYYGAGNWGLNWNENQYDITLKPGKKVGEKVEILKTEPVPANTTFINELSTGAAGSGDNSLIFLPPYSNIATVEGTVPAGNSFTISGSLPEPFTPLAAAIKTALTTAGISHSGEYRSSLDFALQKKEVPHYQTLIGKLYSPPLDSILYFFMKKSINLYGEDLLKIIALQQTGRGTTTDGVQSLKKFWQAKGVDSIALNCKDGSGLSAQTKVTTEALVTALLYAKKQSWYPAFYNSLPVLNDMHVKTGTIGGVKAFSGYYRNAAGQEYTFSFIVNNYNGATASVVQKMYGLLDELKK